MNDETVLQILRNQEMIMDALRELVAADEDLSIMLTRTIGDTRKQIRLTMDRMVAADTPRCAHCTPDGACSIWTRAQTGEKK